MDVFPILADKIRHLDQNINRFFTKTAALAKLAEMTELSDNFIALLERGQRSPSIHTLVKIGIALNASLAELFQVEEDDLEKTNAEQILRKLIEGRDIDEITFIEDVSRFILSKLEGKSKSHLT